MRITRATVLISVLILIICQIQQPVIFAGTDELHEGYVTTDETTNETDTNGTDTDETDTNETDTDEIDTDEKSVDSGDALREWLDKNGTVGGTVYLSGNITETTMKIMPDAPVVIDTGSFGLDVDNLTLNENVSLIGEGVDNPVVTCTRINLSNGICITSTGKGSEGGTALCFKGASWYRLSTSAVSYYGGGKAIRIQSYGKKAVGIQFNYPDPLDADAALDYVIVETEGEESVCVRGAIDMQIRLCAFIANGINSKSIDGSMKNVTALFSNVGDAAGVKQYHYTEFISNPINGHRFNLNVQTLVGNHNPSFSTDINIWLLSDGLLETDGIPWEYNYFPTLCSVTWDDSGVDYSQPGIYDITYYLTLPFDPELVNLVAVANFLEPFTLQGKIHVQTTSRPELSFTQSMSNYSSTTVEFPVALSWEAREQAELYLSFDGVTWESIYLDNNNPNRISNISRAGIHEATQMQFFLLNENLNIRTLPINTPFWLKMYIPETVVEGPAGWSVPVQFICDGNKVNAIEGDRDGGDRGEQNIPIKPGNQDGSGTQDDSGKQDNSGKQDDLGKQDDSGKQNDINKQNEPVHPNEPHTQKDPDKGFDSDEPLDTDSDSEHLSKTGSGNSSSRTSRSGNSTTKSKNILNDAIGGLTIYAASYDEDVPSPVETEIPFTREQDGENFITLSGARLAALTDGSGAVTIIKNGVRAVFSKEFLSRLNLSSNEMFTALIERPTDYQLTVKLYVGGNELNGEFDLPYELRFDGYTENLVFLRYDKETVYPASLLDDGCFSASLTRTGNFIIETDNPVEQAPAVSVNTMAEISAHPEENQKIPIAAMFAGIGGCLVLTVAPRRIYRFLLQHKGVKRL